MPALDGRGYQGAPERLTEEFWSYSERWSPSFEGVQPYLLPGLLDPSTEAQSLQLLQVLMRVAWDAVVDTSPTRHLLTIIAFMPPLYLKMCGHAGTLAIDVAEVSEMLCSAVLRPHVPAEGSGRPGARHRALFASAAAVL